MPTYTDMLAAYGVTTARPGGKKITEYVLQAFPINGDDILEIGSGLGETANYVSKTFDVKISAIEQNKKMIEKGKARHKDNKHIDWIHSNFLTFESEKKYDCIIIESVLSFTNVFQSLEKISSLLKNNGRLYLLEPIYLGGLEKEILEKYMKFYDFQIMLSEKQWLKALTDEQLEVLKIISSVEMENEAEDVGEEEMNFPFPELVIDENLEEKYVDILNEHMELTNKYLAYFDYAYFICEKKC